MKVELDIVPGKAFGRPKGVKKGSKKFARISDGFGEWIVKWWGGVWRIRSFRENTKVATSLYLRALSRAEDEARTVREEEKYDCFVTFSERLVKIVGVNEAFRIIQWIKG